MYNFDKCKVGDSIEINKEAVGIRIKQIRLEKGLTLEEFGKLVDNASKSIVSKWERGKTIPNNKRLKIIAELSGSTVFELLYGSGYEYLMQNLPRLLYVNQNEIEKNISLIIMPSLNYLAEKIEQEISSPTNEEGIKRIIYREYPKIKENFMKDTDKRLSFINSNLHLKDKIMQVMEDPNYIKFNDDDFFQRVEYVFRNINNLSFTERIEYSTEIDSIYTEIEKIISFEKTIFLETHAPLIDGDYLIKNIDDLNLNNLDSSSHYLKYKKSERIEPLNEPNEIILIKYKGFSNHKNLIGESIVLVRYFPRFKHEFLEKYYKNSHILCVQHNDIYFGYLNDRLQLETEINNKYFQFDLSKHNDNRYYLPVLSIFY